MASRYNTVFLQELLIPDPSTFSSVKALHDGTDGWKLSSVVITLVNQDKIYCVQSDPTHYIDNSETKQLQCSSTFTAHPQSIQSIVISTASSGSSGISASRNTQIWIVVCEPSDSTVCVKTPKYNDLSLGEVTNVTSSADPTDPFEVNRGIKVTLGLQMRIAI